MFALLVIE